MSNIQEKDSTVSNQASTKQSQTPNRSGNYQNQQEKGTINKSSFDTISQFFIDLLKKIGNFFKSPEGSYKDNPERHQSAHNTIDQMSERANDLKEQGDYTGAYLMERQKIYVEALHETCMEKDYTEKDTDLLAHDAAELATIKIAELDKSELGQVARNDYMSDLSEYSLASIHSDISQQATAIYQKNFGIESQEMISRLAGNDLNTLVNDQNSFPLTPNEKENGLNQELDSRMDQSISQSQDMSIQPSVEPSTPSPGR